MFSIMIGRNIFFVCYDTYLIYKDITGEGELNVLVYVMILKILSRDNNTKQRDNGIIC